MINPLKTPANSYTDFYDIARFRLAWKINIILSISLLVISVYFSFHNTTTFAQYFAGFVIVLTGVIYLMVTKKFLVVSYFIIFSSLALVLSSLFFVKNMPHLIEPLWLVIITIFAYFNLGRSVGNIVLFIVSITVSLYYYFFLNSNKTLQEPYSSADLIGLVIEFTLCMLIIGYFIYKFLQTTAYAEQKLKAANEELNAQYELIRMQNEEKTVLLQEIHHRVKNNLQVITSLLRLQQSEMESEETQLHFNDAINRIMTMSLIHQKMYQEKNLSKIDIEDYFKTLIADLIDSSSIQIPVEVNIRCSVDRVGQKTIVPLALLVAELITNSLKHAFTEKGTINLILRNEDQNRFSLIYEDNGTWKEPVSTESFGLQLVQTLTDQLEGKLERTLSDNGTHFEFDLLNLED
jgi:two-component sensor histidine kinase